MENSNHIVLQVEFNDYSIEHIKFDSLRSAKEYYFNNLSQLKLLTIMYKDKDNNNIKVDSSYIYR